jgi:CRISPR-associated protein Csx10
MRDKSFNQVILCEDGDVITIQMLLVTEPNIWLGGSQSAGYGHTKIIDLKTLIIGMNWNSSRRS